MFTYFGANRCKWKVLSDEPMGVPRPKRRVGLYASNPRCNAKCSAGCGFYASIPNAKKYKSQPAGLRLAGTLTGRKFLDFKWVKPISFPFSTPQTAIPAFRHFGLPGKACVCPARGLMPFGVCLWLSPGNHHQGSNK